MLIAALQKLSLIDYPGRLSAIVFTQGCNFFCPYCQNPGLVRRKGGKKGCAEGEVLEYLAKRKNIVTGLVITGGEPLIHDSLPEFTAKVKNIGIKIKLDTNGSNPRLLKKLLDKDQLDYIALDVKTSFEKYKLVTGMKNISSLVRESVKLAGSGVVPYEFRTTCVPTIVEKEDFLKIGEEIKGAEKWCLQQFRPDITLNKKFYEIQPYSKETLEDLKNVLAGYAKKIELRGV